MSDAEPYEPVYNGWSLKGWLAMAPLFALLGGLFFGLPRVMAAGSVLFLGQTLWMVVTGKGVSSRAEVSGRQAGVGLSTIALAGCGYAFTYAVLDERWMWLCLPAAPMLAIFGVLLWRGTIYGIGVNRWAMLASCLGFAALFAVAATGALT